MSSTSHSDIDAVLQDVIEAEARDQRALSVLLGKQRMSAGHHLAIQVYMGDVASFLTSVSLGWVADHVRFAADLPIFRDNEHGSKRVEIDETTLEQIQQRRPDWRRQLRMTGYLAKRRHHKFPTLLVVGYQGWVYQETDDKWGVDHRAVSPSLTLRGLEPSATYWDIDESDTNFYALDGQHRLMAIRGLRDLLANRQLHALDEVGSPKREGTLYLDEIVNEIHGETGDDAGIIHDRLQRLMDERIGIEIVPAVIEGETYKDALLRLRQMFVDVNENAKALTDSQLAQLDESNGFRVVARGAMMKHDLLRPTRNTDGTQRTKVETEKNTLPETSESYTTLKTLVAVVERHLTENRTLGDHERFSSWKSFIDRGVAIRPEEPLLERGTDAMINYFNALAQLPSHEEFIQGKRASELRAGESDNIVFRPLVQTALAEAVGKLVTAGASLESIVSELSRQELQGQLRLTERTSPWFGVLCDPVPNDKGRHNMRRHKANEKLCTQLLVYLLGGGIEEDSDRRDLRRDFALARRIDEEKAIDLRGETVSIKDVRLPNPWR